MVSFIYYCFCLVSTFLVASFFRAAFSFYYIFWLAYKGMDFMVIFSYAYIIVLASYLLPTPWLPSNSCWCLLSKFSLLHSWYKYLLHLIFDCLPYHNLYASHLYFSFPSLLLCFAYILYIINIWWKSVIFVWLILLNTLIFNSLHINKIPVYTY